MRCRSTRRHGQAGSGSRAATLISRRRPPARAPRAPTLQTAPPAREPASVPEATRPNRTPGDEGRGQPWPARRGEESRSGAMPRSGARAPSSGSTPPRRGDAGGPGSSERRQAPRHRPAPDLHAPAPLGVQRQVGCNSSHVSTLIQSGTPPSTQGFGFITPAASEGAEPLEDLFVHQVRYSGRAARRDERSPLARPDPARARPSQPRCAPQNTAAARGAPQRRAAGHRAARAHMSKQRSSGVCAAVTHPAAPAPASSARPRQRRHTHGVTSHRVAPRPLPPRRRAF